MTTSTPSANEIRHLLSVDDLADDELLRVLDHAEELLGGASSAWVDKHVVLAFFEESLRTRVGFHAAAARLHSTATDLTESRHGSGTPMPERIGDTLRVASGMADVMVVRHPDAVIADEIRERCVCPVVSGGLGSSEHPTQALVDLFAIRRAVGHLDNLVVCVVGDLLESRSAHSLIRALRLFHPKELRLIAPEGRSLESEWLDGFDPSSVTRGQKLDVGGCDVVYMAGLPAGPHGIGAALRADLALSPSHLAELGEESVVLSPLPRLDEVDPDCDADPRCKYFGQSDEGVYIRMAVLEMLS